MKGTLYGVGVGPGDPELLTLKAVRRMREADVIAVPGKNRDTTVAYRIASAAVPEIAQKESVEVEMPMTKDPALLEKSHALAAKQIQAVLDQGKNVAFLTLGDPCIYSTYLYIHRRIGAMGYETEIVNGIPSFCAAAARLNQGLVEEKEELHIIPASYQIRDALALPGVKVLMKAGKKIGEVKETLLQSKAEAVMIENCGMPGEVCYKETRDIPEQAGYYSLMIVRE